MEKRVVEVRGVKLGDGNVRICIPVTAEDFGELRRQTERVSGAPSDLVEWRADYYQGLEDREVLAEALGFLREALGGKPVLFTFRTKEEGGQREITDESYVSLLLAAAQSGKIDLADIELRRFEKLPEDVRAELLDALQRCGVRSVFSYHDFAATPGEEELVSILMRMQELGADITKAAVMPESRRDVLTLLAASVRMAEECADRPFITMSMGRLGAVSRLAGGFTGSCVTFATAGRASAPGQMEAGLLAGVLPRLN